MKSWLRFFYHVEDPNEELKKNINKFPNHFEINQAYYEQNKDEDQSVLKDEFGSVYIPSPTNFFFVLTRTTLYVLLARKNDLAKTYKSLEISWLLPRLERQDFEDTQQCKGGLQNIGDFEQGYCFRLKSKTHAIWDICCNCKSEKEKWMKAIYELMSSEKTIRDNGIILPLQESLNNLVYLNNNVDRNKTIVTDQFRDGQWVVIQDWSQCSLACGGGKSFLQRFCIPPGRMGKPCEGQRVLEKSCNTEPCENIMNVFKRDGEQMPVQLGIMKLSDKKNRFEMCVIKEGDISVILDRQLSPEVKFKPRIPGRAVMNNQTLSIFMLGGDSYQNVYRSFELKYIQVDKYSEDSSSCIQLKDLRDPSNKRAVICTTIIDLRPDQTIEQQKDQWIKDINIFKTRCRSKFRSVKTNDIETQFSQKEEEFKVKLEQEKEKIKIQQIEEIENEKKQQEVESVMENTAKNALTNVEKEMKFEQLAIQDEIMKEKMAEKEWIQQIEKEQERDIIVQKELERKAKLREYEKREQEVEEKVKGIKQQAINQIKLAREKVTQKIQMMRKAMERRKKQAIQKIIEIRTKIASELLQESKEGDEQECNPNQGNEKIMEYCQDNFITEPSKMEECINGQQEDFCYICCENEFGRMHQDKREHCYVMCDSYTVSKTTLSSNNQQRLKTDMHDQDNDQDHQDHINNQNNDNDDDDNNNYHNNHYNDQDDSHNNDIDYHKLQTKNQNHSNQ